MNGNGTKYLTIITSAVVAIPLIAYIFFGLEGRVRATEGDVSSLKQDISAIKAQTQEIQNVRNELRDLNNKWDTFIIKAKGQ